MPPGPQKTVAPSCLPRMHFLFKLLCNAHCSFMQTQHPLNSPQVPRNEAFSAKPVVPKWEHRIPFQPAQQTDRPMGLFVESPRRMLKCLSLKRVAFPSIKQLISAFELLLPLECRCTVDYAHVRRLRLGKRKLVQHVFT